MEVAHLESNYLTDRGASPRARLPDVRTTSTVTPASCRDNRSCRDDRPRGLDLNFLVASELEDDLKLFCSSI